MNCDAVSPGEITEISSRHLSTNIQSYLSILDVLGWNDENM